MSLIQKWDKHLKELSSVYPSRVDDKVSPSLPPSLPPSVSLLPPIFINAG